MGKIVGIDLGTTTSGVAYIENGKPKMIVNNMGKSIIPSVIGLNDDNEIIFGDEAYNQLENNRFMTVEEFKRFMGTNKKIKMGEKEFLAQDLSAMLLSKLKEVAEEYLGYPIEEAVITVPASFHNEERKLTKEAGERAGFKVERIINEPTAAAMAYGINNLDKDAKVLVYDLGGGTFDVTILEMYDGILDVICSRGNPKLGGKDFDERIIDFIKEEFKKLYNIEIYDCYDPKDNVHKSTLRSRVKNAAIKAKKELSVKEHTNIDMPFFSIIDGNPINIDIELNRCKFDELTKDLVLSTKDVIEEALNVKNLTPEDIDEVLLVGGSSRIVAVKNLVNSIFPNKIKSGINPDEAVSLGAAVQAGIKNSEISSEDGLIVTDKCNCNLGTEVVNDIGGRLVEGVFDILIPIDSSIPCSKKKTYSTMHENQEAVNVGVYEGNAHLVYENKKIGEVLVEGIPKGKAGEQNIEIEFKYDLNEILTVIVTILSTGKSIEATYNINNVRNQSNSDPIDEYINRKDNIENWKNYKLAINVKSIINLAEKKIKKLDSEKANKIQELVNELKTAVINDDENLVDKLDNELTDILFEV